MKYAAIVEKSYTDGVGFDANTYKYRDFIELQNEEALKNWYLEYQNKRFYSGTLLKVIRFDEVKLHTSVEVILDG